MRVSKEKAAENREALLRAASKLFREKGIDGVGVADVAREAGLTHGALYAHFSSKDALAAAAFSEGFAGNMAAMRAWAGDRSPSFADYVAALMSERMRDRLATGCPMAASASEAGRQGEAFSESFARAFEEEVAMVEASLDRAILDTDRRQRAIAAITAHIGAMAVSRAVLKAAPALSHEVLQATQEAILDNARANEQCHAL